MLPKTNESIDRVLQKPELVKYLERDVGWTPRAAQVEVAVLRTIYCTSNVLPSLVLVGGHGVRTVIAFGAMRISFDVDFDVYQPKPNLADLHRPLQGISELQETTSHLQSKFYSKERKKGNLLVYESVLNPDNPTMVHILSVRHSVDSYHRSPRSPLQEIIDLPPIRVAIPEYLLVQKTRRFLLEERRIEEIIDIPLLLETINQERGAGILRRLVAEDNDLQEGLQSLLSRIDGLIAEYETWGRSSYDSDFSVRFQGDRKVEAIEFLRLARHQVSIILS